MSNATWLLVGFLAGVITTVFVFLLSQAMTHQSMKFVKDNEDIFFEPELPTHQHTTLEDHDIVISGEEEEAE